MPPSEKILRNPEVLMKILDEETVLYDTRQGEAHFLNETASHIWNLCDGTRREIEIISEMTRRFEAPGKVVEHDVHDTLKNLRERKLIH